MGLTCHHPPLPTKPGKHDGKRRADARYPSDDDLVALMALHRSFGKVAAACGVRRESLRDFLSRRPELDARMREHQKPRLTAEQAQENDRRASREYAARQRRERPEEIRRARREHMRNYDASYRRRWNNYNRLRRRGLKRSGPEADEYADILTLDPCSYCGSPCEHIDHVDPIARGGTGDFDNLTAACASCNLRKQARPLLTFLLMR